MAGIKGCVVQRYAAPQDHHSAFCLLTYPSKVGMREKTKAVTLGHLVPLLFPKGKILYTNRSHGL